MSCSTCTRRSLWQDLSRAAAKLASSRLRTAGALKTHPQWTTRAATCEFCPIRVIHKGTSYCGKPFLQQVDRDPIDGCGCPVNDKAKDPSEHCPVNSRHQPATKSDGSCSCKWCVKMVAP